MFTPCGYSCNGLLDDAYFTIHITPEPECSFVSFETNVVMENYTELVQKVINIFKPNNWTMSLFVDEKSKIPDSRAGCSWSYSGYSTTGTTNHMFPSQYNATCAQFEAINDMGIPAQISPVKHTAEYGTSVDRLSKSPTITAQHHTTLCDHEMLTTPSMSLNSYTYDSIKQMSLLQMRELVISSAVGRYTIEPSNVIPIDQKHNDVNKLLISNITDIVQESAVRIIAQHLPEQSFTLVDIGQLIRKYYIWSHTLSNITPVYHVNTHIDRGILSTLSTLGCAFACNSVAATRSVLRLGIDSKRITLNSPHLPISTLQFAREKSIDLITVHTLNELQSVRLHYNTANILILYSFDYEHTLGVNNKSDLQTIITHANEYKLTITGIRLNLPALLPITTLIQHLRSIHTSITECGLSIEVLDLGNYNLSIDTNTIQQCQQVIQLLSELFAGVEILANCEPYMNDHISGLAVNVLEKRVHTKSADNHTDDSKEQTNVSPYKKHKHIDVTYYVADDTLTDTINYRNEAIASLANQSLHSNKSSISAICSVSSSTVAYIDELIIPTTDQYEWIYLPNIDPITPTKLTDAPDVYYIAS